MQEHTKMQEIFEIVDSHVQITLEDSGVQIFIRYYSVYEKKVLQQSLHFALTP